MTDTPATAVASPAQRVLDSIAAVVIAIAAIALVGLVLVQSWQVFTRYVLNDSPSWTEPVTLLLLATAMGMGAVAGVVAAFAFAARAPRTPVPMVTP